jgi:hypothetical protein
MDVRTRHTCASSMPPHVHLEHRQLSTDARTESTHLRGSTRMMFLTMRTPTTFCRFFTYTGIRLCPVLSWQRFRVRFRVCSSPHSSCAFAMPVYGGGQGGRAGGAGRDERPEAMMDCMQSWSRGWSQESMKTCSKLCIASLTCVCQGQRVSK